MTETIRVMFVDDHELLRRGLQLVFETMTGIEVVGEASDGNEALARIPDTKPDVVVSDARDRTSLALHLAKALGR
ncbi:MAG: response regulator transcription factor [Gulosibacter sp.]|uniref:response regulator transcription factor n=1 Tax=Gulosibacter sp. TaxID=2817531 RepID=UPI003F8F562B